MPHNCTLYPWYEPAGSLITLLEEQEIRWGRPGWAQFYDSPAAYQELVALEQILATALADPSPWAPPPYQVPQIPSNGVELLAQAIIAGLPQDETSTPPPVPPPPPPPAHTPGTGWLLTPVDDPNWAAIDRARLLLDRVRAGLDT